MQPRWPSVAAASLVLVLLGASGYELALALGAGSIGPESGAGPAGAGAVLLIALLALLAGSLLSWCGRSRAHFRGGWPSALLAPAGAAFVTARFYTYDP